MENQKDDILKELGYLVTFKAPQKPPHKIKNKFYWWRRYNPHQNLSKYVTFDKKVENGDFDYSPYAAQSQYEQQWMVDDIIKVRNNDQIEDKREAEREIQTSYNKRIIKLDNDFLKDEFNRLDYLKSCLKKQYGGTQEQIDYFLFEVAVGELKELPLQYKAWLIQQNPLVSCIFSNF